VNDARCGPALGEKASDGEGVNNAINDVRKLIERWENRLTLKNLSLSKRYLKGELVLHLHWRGNLSSEMTHYCAVFHGSEKILPSHLDRGVGFGGDEETPEGADSQRQHLMFVSGIDGVQIPECFVPTLVGFGRLDDIHRRFLVRTLWFSLKSGFEFVGGVEDREIGLARRGTGAVNREAPKDVQGRSEIVDGIRGNSAPPERSSFALEYAKDIAPDVHIWLGNETIRISSEEYSRGRLQLSDVLFGPFDLDPSTGYPATGRSN